MLVTQIPEEKKLCGYIYYTIKNMCNQLFIQSLMGEVFLLKLLCAYTVS